MDKVTDVMDKVMDESTDSDECYDCDGKNEKSDELENNVESKVSCNMKTEGDLEKEIILNKVSQMPSPSSPKQAKTQRGQEEVIDSQSTITVGDRVTVEDAPAYWSWASPFTVEAIDGEMAKLEMVGELVEIERLSVING